MKKTVLLIALTVSIAAFAGCGKKPDDQTGASPTPTPVATGSEQPKKTPTPEMMENANKVQVLAEELENTTDETKRREILDEIQVLLEKVEEQQVQLKGGE